MKALIAFLLSVITCQNIIGAEEDIRFELLLHPTEWKAPVDNTANPVFLLWKARNASASRTIILPIGADVQLELIDEKGTRVPGGVYRDLFLAYSSQDYREIRPGWSTYISAGDLSLYWENKMLFIGGASKRGGWIKYGPLHREKYKLRCTFATGEEPSAYAKKAWRRDDMWLGTFASDCFEIELK